MSAADPEDDLEQRIAVIGMAARLPGAPDLDAFWKLLVEGREGLRRYQDDELAAAGAQGRPADPGFVPVSGALDGAAGFDAEFFGFTPAEAEVTDPQHRVFLECAWEALENAGYAGGAGLGRVGVFGGASRTDYRYERIAAHPRAARLWHPVQVAIGNDIDNMPLRVSYKLGLTGPSMTVQTACSSSLTAVHLACQSLLLRESDLALAGGASVRLLEPSGYVYQEGGILSPDGHCKPFDAAGQGTVPGDGVGLVVLKRLDDAERDGDHIRAVILGSAVNNDGAAKLGFTAPSTAGQAAVIAEALAAAAIEPETVDYVEAHGTATPLGDPIEVQALAAAFGKRAEANGARRLLGSVKSNIGHLDAASGIAGFIKTVLALEHRYIPPTLHYRQPNPAADLDGSGLRVVAQGEPWPRTGHAPRAGVSSFGFGGTNVHVVLEAAAQRDGARERDAWQVLTLSARTPAALAAAGERLERHLSAAPDTDLADAAFTLQTGRAQMPWRRAVVVPADDVRAAVELLRGTVREGDLAVGGAGTGAAPGGADSPRPIAFLLPGQGSQYAGMGRELYRDQPVFRAAVDECAQLFARHLELDLRGVLFDRGAGAEANLARTVHTQPALFTVEIALARLLAHWGVRPAAMLGHSLGELVAACLAGVFTLDDAALVVAARARLIQRTPSGRMLAVMLPAEQVRALLGDLVADGAPGSVAIAAVNAPTACVIAGDEAGAERAGELLREKGVACRALATSHAFHTALLEPALPEFARVVRRARLQRPRIPFVSNTTGTWITDAQATDPDYWVRQVRLPVAFSAGITTLLGAEVPPALLEVGPGTALRGLARLHRGAAGAVAVASSLPRSRSGDVAELRSVLEGVAASWEQGAAVDWAGTRTAGTARRVPLPTYPFERRVHLLPRPGAPAPAPDPAEPVSADTAAAAGPAAAPDGFAALVAEVWRDVLGLESIGLHDDFYLLGGNSLSAIQIMGRLREIEPDLPMSAIFTAPTVAGLAAAVGARQDGGAALEDLDPALLEALLDEIEGLEPDDGASRPSEGEV